MAVTYNKNNQTSGLNSDTRLNTELTKIQTAFQDCVSRSGGAPNAMSADFDMGGNDILNAGTVNCSDVLIDGLPIPSLSDITAQAAAAAASETAAATSASEAAASAASIGLPSLSGASAGDLLEVNGTTDGYALVSQLDTSQISDTAITLAKLNSSNYASQAEAGAGTDTTKLMTPSTTQAALEAFPFTEDVTYTIGFGGDFATINAALDFVKLRKSAFVLDTAGQHIVTLRILTGETISEQIVVAGENLSWIQITSADATVPVARSGFTGNFSEYFIKVVNGGTSPVINTHFVLDASGTPSGTVIGAYAADGSTVLLSDSLTVGANAAYCLYATRGSTIVGASSESYLGGTTTPVLASSSSTIDIPGSTVASYSAVTNGILCTSCSRINFDGGTITASGGSYTDTVLSAEGSVVNAQGVTINTSGVSTDFKVLTGGTINAGSSVGTLSQTANSVAAAGIIFQ